MDYLASTFWRQISVLFWSVELLRYRARGSSPLDFAFSFAELFPRALDKLIARCNFIDQAELQSFLRGIKFSFQNHFSGFFRADQPRQARATSPRRGQPERGFGEANPRRWIIARDTVIAGQS